MKTIRERIDELAELKPEALALGATLKAWGIGYLEGTQAALDRMRMVAATTPESVTKQRLLDMMKREIAAAEKAALEATR